MVLPTGGTPGSTAGQRPAATVPPASAAAPSQPSERPGFSHSFFVSDFSQSLLPSAATQIRVSAVGFVLDGERRFVR